MTRISLLPGALLAAVLATTLAGCGNETAVDGGFSAESPSASPTPTETPSIGGRPAYPHADYSYDLEVQCFCSSVGQPIRVTVEDGEVASATWTTKNQDHAQGDEATEEWLRLTIDDILTEAADPRWDEVDMDWPGGQDYPDRVAIDRMENAMDDEVTYLLSQVEPVSS